jgi:ABC-2 type transport system permease protein
MVNLLRHELGIRRGAVIGWSIGITLLVVYVIALFPELSPMFGDMNFGEIEIYQMFGDFSDMASFPSFMSIYLFTYLPTILAIYALTNGTNTLAGEEDSGTLEIIMSLPLPRWKLLMSKMIALAVALLLILLIVAAAALGTVMVMDDKLDTQGVTNTNIVVSILSTWPLVLLFASISLFLGTVMPNRRLAAWTATVFLIISFVGNNLAAVSEPLEKIQFLFPFHYFDGKAILVDGAVSSDIFILLGAAAVFLGLALLAFEQRNVMVGAWPWQRARLSG